MEFAWSDQPVTVQFADDVATLRPGDSLRIIVTAGAEWASAFAGPSVDQSAPSRTAEVDSDSAPDGERRPAQASPQAAAEVCGLERLGSGPPWGEGEGPLGDATALTSLSLEGGAGSISATITLPPTGGWYCVCVHGAGRVLGWSRPVLVYAPVHQAATSAEDACSPAASGVLWEALVEDMRQLQCLSVVLTPTRGSCGGSPRLPGGVNHVTATLQQTEELGEDGEWELEVHCEVGGRHSIARVRLPGGYDLGGTYTGELGETQQGNGPTATVNWEEGQVLVRLPYSRSPSGSATLQDALAAFAQPVPLSGRCVSCGACAGVVVRAAGEAELFPSGRFDENFDEFMCCEHPVGPLCSLDLLPRRGALRLSPGALSVHPMDVAAGSVVVRERSSAQTGPVSELCCAGCGQPLGEAVCSMEIMERWINAGGPGDGGCVEGGPSEYRPELLSEVRLFTHRVVASRSAVGAPSVLLAAALEQVVAARILELVRSRGPSTVYVQSDAPRPGSVAAGEDTGAAVLRVLSTDVGVCCMKNSELSDEILTISPRSAIKLCFRHERQTGVNLATKQEERNEIILNNADFNEIMDVLRQRQQRLPAAAPKANSAASNPWKTSYMYT